MGCTDFGYADNTDNYLKQQLWADLNGVGFNDVELWFDDICLIDVINKIEK